MASNLTAQVRSISEVTKAVAMGDLGKLVDVDVQGEMLDLKVLLLPFLSVPTESIIDDRQFHGGPIEYFG